MMSAPAGNGRDETPEPRKRRVSGTTVPSGGGKPPSGGKGTASPPQLVTVPVPVALNWSSVIKLVGPSLALIVAAFGAAIYFYHQANTHMADPTIHLTRGERAKLETKDEARKHRQKIHHAIIREAKVAHRELQVRQAEQISKWGKELKREQARVLRAVRTKRP